MSVAYSRPVVEYPYGASRIRVRTVQFNHAPQIVDQTVVTLEDTAVPLTLSAMDVDGDELAFAVAQAPASGQLSGVAPELVYTPAAGFSGEDAFTVEVSDGYDTVTQSVRIVVLPQEARPVAAGGTLETPEDTPLELRLDGTVAPGAQAVYEIVDAPSHGMFKGTAPDLQYNPDADWHGEDFFTFRVGDGVRVSDLAVVRVTVTPVNDAPVALAQDVTGWMGRAIPVLLTGTDVDGDELTFAIRAKPAHGTLTGRPPLLNYRPVKNFVGEDAFSFVVSDGEFTSAPAVVRVTVDGQLRRELDGDASWFGCSAAPGVGGGGVRGNSPTMSPSLQSDRLRSRGYGGTLALLLIGLGLVVMRRWRG